MEKKTIVVIGDVILDIIPGVFPIDKKIILNDGETFIDNVVFQKGGCAGNFTCVLKSIVPEHNVRFISKIGDDRNGTFLINEMERFGVEHRFSVSSNKNTQITIAVSYNDGERHFLTYLGALDDFNLDDIDKKDLEGISHLAYRGPWFSEKLLFNIAPLLKKVHERGITISMDLGFDPYWNKQHLKEFKEHAKRRKDAIISLLPYIDYLFGNEGELMNLTDSNTVDDALAYLFKNGARTIILHRGSKGSSVISANNSANGDNDVGYIRKDVPAIRVKTILNPVGSGDTFDSIFIAKILEGADPIAACVYATAGAAYLLQSPPGTSISLDKIGTIINEHEALKSLLN